MAKSTRKNQDFGDIRETAPTDADFLRGVGEHMGRKRSTMGKKMAAFGVWFVVGSFMALTVFSALQVNQNRLLNESLKSTLETQYNPSFKTRYSDLGKSIAESWYNTNPSPAPVELAGGVTWPHSTTSDVTDFDADFAEVTADGGPQYKPTITVRNVTFINGEQVQAPDVAGQYYEVDYYSAYVDGSLSVIAVTLGIANLDDYSSLPTLMSEPTILPNDGALGETITTTQPNWYAATASDNMKAQVESWAKAYSENDSNSLKQITGDSGDNFYIGAVSAKGWKYVANSAQVVWVKEKAGDTNYAVAQVSWKMKLPDFQEPNPNNPQEQITRLGATQTQRMEILIEAPKSGLPLVVAWGPVGTFSVLTPEMNSLTKEDFDALKAFYNSGGSTAPVEGEVEDGGDTGTSGDSTDGTTDGTTDESTAPPSDDTNPSDNASPTPAPTEG